MFRAFVQYNLLKDNGVTLGSYGSLESDTLKAALYDNDITPDKNAAITSTGYNTGQWAISGNEVSDGTNWDSGGEPVTGGTFTAGSGYMMFDASDTSQGGTTCTLSNVYGCLVYDDDTTTGTGGVADQGVTYHYFGGAQSVTSGTFTIVWHANGLFRITV
jgi:hypothetical protein